MEFCNPNKSQAGSVRIPDGVIRRAGLLCVCEEYAVSMSSRDSNSAYSVADRLIVSRRSAHAKKHVFFPTELVLSLSSGRPAPYSSLYWGTIYVIVSGIYLRRRNAHRATITFSTSVA